MPPDGPRPGLAGPVLVTAGGVLVMVVAGVVAGRYTPFWFDPDEGCALLGRCQGPDADDALSALWVLMGAGFAVVLLGVALAGARLARTPWPPPDRPLPDWALVAAGGVAGAAVCAVLGWFVLVAVLMSAPAAPAALCLLWLVQAIAVTALELRGHRSRDDGSVLPAWLTGLAVGAVAVAAPVGWAVAVRGPVAELPVVAGAAVALGLLVRRAAVAGARPWPAALGVLVVLGVAAAALTGTSGGHRPDDRAGDGPVRLPGPPPALPPSTLPPSTPAPPRPADAPPDPTPPSAAPVVDAAVACAPGELAWHVTGWDAAMGTRAVTVVATSGARRPCYVDGFVRVGIGQGGRELRLTTEPGSATALEAPQPRRVGLAPGGSASVVLVWEGHGAAADSETPQELRVALDGGGPPSTVPLGASPAPFDLTDGGMIRVGPWQPGVP